MKRLRNHPKFNSSLIMLLIISVVFLGLRLYAIEQRVNFSMDQGMFMLRAREIWENKELTLLGPATSLAVEGRHFFQGPMIYYSLVVLGWLGGWDPIKISWWLALAGLAANLVLGKVLKETAGERTAWLYLILITFLPLSVRYSNFIWNPNFLLIFMPLVLASLIKAVREKGMKWWLLSGFLAGVAGQFHYQFGVVWLGITIWTLIKTRSLTKTGLVILGIIGGWLPLIIFDIRNDFYNIKTIGLWLTTKNDSPIILREYYWLWLGPVVTAGLAVWMKRTTRTIQFLIVILVMGWGVFSIFGKGVDTGMPEGWTYANLKKCGEVVIRNGSGKINVANAVSGDTRFYPLRYYLEWKGIEVGKIDDYQNSDSLVVLEMSRSGETIESSNLWEIRSFGGHVVNEWPISDRYSLFELKK